MAEFPALPLFTDAYLADCSHLDDAEHGRYLLLLMLMWRTPKFKIPNDDDWIARHMRRSVERVQAEIRPLIAEFCKTDGNWIWQPRLLREARFIREKTSRRSAAAKARWQKQKAGYNAYAPTPTPTPTPIIKNKGRAKALPVDGTPPTRNGKDADQAMELWNQFAKPRHLPTVAILTEARRRSLMTRLDEIGGINGWKRVLVVIDKSPLLLGQKGTWRISFDWIVKAANMVKTVEGNYVEEKTGSSVAGNGGANRH